MIQPQKSWRATTWHTEPQKKRPRRAVAMIANAKKTKPALSCPSLMVYIDSEGSTGERVGFLPPKYQKATWAMMARLTMTRIAARRGPMRDFLALGPW